MPLLYLAPAQGRESNDLYANAPIGGQRRPGSSPPPGRSLASVGTWDRLRAALRRETKDVQAALSDLESRTNATLDEKERMLQASPSEKMAMEQAKARALDDQFEALRRKVDGDAQK